MCVCVIADDILEGRINRVGVLTSSDLYTVPLTVCGCVCVCVVSVWLILFLREIFHTHIYLYRLLL